MWGTRARSGTRVADETWPRDVDGFADEHQRIINLQRLLPAKDYPGVGRLSRNLIESFPPSSS